MQKRPRTRPRTEGKPNKRENMCKDSLVDVRKWEELDTDCLVNIFSRVELETLALDLPLVCKSWYKASLYPQLWKILDFKSVEQRMVTFRRVQWPDFIRLAVKRSGGLATKVVLPTLIDEQYEFEDIMHHISEGCPALKNLTLPKESLDCMPELIQKWQDLEFLCMKTTFYFKETLSQIQTHCKDFTGLTISRQEIGSEEASAIVTHLPNINYLVLSGCLLFHENLLLILSKCRDLELLDVSNCSGFDADDTEILSMASHIKKFTPTGSTVGDGMDEHDLGYLSFLNYIMHNDSFR